MTVGVPRLTTSRLELRPLEVDDGPFLLELLNDPGWVEHIGDRGVRDLDGAVRYLEEGPGRSYRAFGYGLMRVARLTDGLPMGICGLVRRETLDAPDLGFAFLDVHTGQGYAREAAAASIRDAFGRVGLSELLAVTSPSNLRSRQLLLRLGFAEVATRTLGDSTLLSVIYRLSPDAERA